MVWNGCDKSQILFSRLLVRPVDESRLWTIFLSSAAFVWILLQLLADACSCLVGIFDTDINGSYWSKLVSHHVPSPVRKCLAFIQAKASNPRKEVEEVILTTILFVFVFSSDCRFRIRFLQRGAAGLSPMSRELEGLGSTKYNHICIMIYRQRTKQKRTKNNAFQTKKLIMWP